VSAYDDDRRVEAAASAADGVLSTLERRAQGIAAVLGGPAAALGVLSTREVPVVLAVTGSPDGPLTTAAGRRPAGLDVRRLVGTARTAMDVSRDTGTAQAAPVVGGFVPLVVARFADGIPPTTQARRAAAVTWHVGVLSPSGVLQGLPSTLPAAVALRVDGRVVGRSEDTKPAGTVLVAGQPWTLLMDDPGAPLSRGAVAILLVAIAGALACLLVDVRTQRLLDRERRLGLALERETRTVAELGPLLHSSLDLAEVLPAVALRLSDEFGLSRFRIQLVAESGQLVDVFAIGSRTGDAANEVDVSVGTVDELPAGVVGCLPLLRAGRTIGRLSFAGHRELGAPQLSALSAASDLIAVATYNVELFEREQASVRRLRELDQLKDAFLGTISHELRTPLTAISGFIRLLRDRWDQLRDEQRREFLERVHANTLSLGLLVDDLLDFARLERQTLNAPPEPIDLDQHVSRTLAQLAPVLGARPVVTDLTPVRALGNPGALERVLANLLTNAAKFSPPDSSISIRVAADSRGATVEVADQGAGIASEDRERVFTRFYRGESDAARGTRGAGIGLSVVRELVHQMGGTVAALPNTPHGTRMVVRLDLEPPQPDTDLTPPVQRSAR
jgi:signal transduction histidine kinase